MVDNNVNEPKPKKYCIVYHGPDDQVAGSLEFEMSELPSHDQIMAILEQHLPGRPIGGWYMMETIAEEKTSKEMPCGHTWAEFVSCDTAGGSFMCGVCQPIGMRVAQLLAERSAFKLLLELSTKPVDVTQAEIVKAHQIVQAVSKAERDAEKDLSADEAPTVATPPEKTLIPTEPTPQVGDGYNIKKHIKRIMEYGPTRVMFNTSGDATTPERAKRDHNVVPDVIFIRKDGWSIGAPESLVEVTRQLYPNEWIGSFRPQDHVEVG